jgi:MscS family membrane protein
LQWCEQINLRIMEEFEKEGIEFAFPTTTTYLAQDSKRPLSISANMLGPEQQLPPEEP